MSTPDLGPILEDLAAGRIDASEAARRIDELKAAAPEPKPVEPSNADLADEPEEEDAGRRQFPPYARDVFGASAPDAGPGPGTGRRRPTGSKGVDRISVRAVGRRVRILGDPTVATASAEGPHVLRRNGSVLEVTSDGDIGPTLDGFSILRPPRSLDELRAMGLGKELFLRINPAIIVDVEVTAGHLSTTDLPYLGKVRVTAGGAELSGVAEANDVLVQAGSATLKGTITTGRSRIRVESGQLTIELADGSNVTVRGEAQLGKVSWSGAHTGQVDEVVLGNGSARLDVGVVMGWANIQAGSAAAEQR
jgi:hypothetical protein